MIFDAFSTLMSLPYKLIVTHERFGFSGNKCEKYDPKNVRGRTKGLEGVKQLVWGGFIGNKLGPIMFINEIIHSDKYIAILQEHLLPFLDTLIADGITHIIFQQDNARPHVSKKT